MLQNFILPFILGLSFFQANAQESVNASGGNASGSGGSNSYSVGQVFYVTNGTGDTEAQGVQQAYEISVIDGIQESISFDFSVYPNPTTDAIVLETESSDLDQLSYVLTDINGKLITQNQIQSNQTILDMTNLAKASYVITIYSIDKQSQSFKILKK